MTIDQYILFISVVGLIVASPGPTFILMVSTVAQRGLVAGAFLVSGVSASIATHYVIAATGLSLVLASSTLAFQVIKAAGAIYLIYLGVRTLFELKDRPGSSFATGADLPKEAGAKSFRVGFLTNLLNPKPVMFYIALFPQFVSAQAENYTLVISFMAISHIAIATSFYMLLGTGVGRIRTWLSSPGIWVAFKGISGAVLVALGARVLLSKAPHG